MHIQDMDGLSYLLWPWFKPINDSVVDQPGEVAAAAAQCVTHGAHCQDHMQVGPDLVHKGSPAGFLAVRQALLAELCSDGADEALLFRVIIQGGHHACTTHATHVHMQHTFSAVLLPFW